LCRSVNFNYAASNAKLDFDLDMRGRTVLRLSFDSDRAAVLQNSTQDDVFGTHADHSRQHSGVPIVDHSCSLGCVASQFIVGCAALEREGLGPLFSNVPAR